MAKVELTETEKREILHCLEEGKPRLNSQKTKMEIGK